MSKQYTGPTPFNISISDTGDTTIEVAGNGGIILGPLGGDYATYDNGTGLALAKQQVAGFLATISPGGHIASLTKLNLNLNNLHNACAKYFQTTAVGSTGGLPERNENVKNIIRLCAAQANVAFPADKAGVTDTQASRDAINPPVDGKGILAVKPGDKIALAVAAFYNIRKAILSELAKSLPVKNRFGVQPGSNILKDFAGDAVIPLPKDLNDDITTIKTVIALATDAIDDNKRDTGANTTTANKIATDAAKKAAEDAKKTAEDAKKAADAAKKAAEDAATKKLAENKKAAAQKYIDENFTAAANDTAFDDAAAAGAAAADLATVADITALKAAVREITTTGTPDTLPDGVTYGKAKTVADASAGGGSPLLTAAKAWFDAYAIVATAAKNAADVVVVGGARKNTRRRSYGHGGRRKSYRRRRY